MIDYVRFCGIIIIVSLVVGACKAMDNPTSLGVWLAKDTGNRPPVRNLMISHWNFHWVLAFAWILHGFPAMYEYVFDYWRVYQNDTSLHWFRLLPWKFVSTQRPAIWQQTVTCEFHPTKSTNNGESAITYIYNYYIHIYIYIIYLVTYVLINKQEDISPKTKRWCCFAMLCPQLEGQETTLRCFSAMFAFLLGNIARILPNTPGFHDSVNDFARGWHLCRGPHAFRGIECCCWAAINMASRGVRTVPYISHILTIWLVNDGQWWLVDYMMVNDGEWWWMMVNDGYIYILIMVH